MAHKRLVRVLLLYRELIPSVRLCGHCQMEALAQNGKIEYKFCQIAHVNSIDLNWPDIVLIGRLDSLLEYEVAKNLTKAGKKLVYILDDDLLNIPETLSSAAHYHMKSVQKNIRGMINVSAAILSPSPLLLKKYVKNGQIGMLTEEPAIEPTTYRSHRNNDIVKIGFAGSIDRTGDIETILKPVLERLHQEYGHKIQFSFFGAIPSFAENFNIIKIPYLQSYDAYREQLNEAEWDIGLAPMPDTPFHACKHYNKFVEYAAAGIVGVFSDVEPYVRAKEKIGIGLFVPNETEAWYQAIKQLIETPERREDLRKQACLYAEEKLNASYIAHILYEEYADFFTYYAPQNKRVRKISSYRIRWFAERIQNLAQLHGWRLPAYILSKLLSKSQGLIRRVFARGKK